MKSDYRRDIEGLRGVAVLLVVLFHARSPGLSAGFIGVDVFFVISGFLITKSMLDENVRTHDLSLLNFWARRIRRLLPSAMVVFLASAPLALMNASTLGWSRVALDIRAVLLYFSNIRFSVISSDYFSVNDGESFFLHSWSLSLEEQFYVMWPSLFVAGVWMSRRSWGRVERTVSILAALLAVVSILISLEMTRRGMSWAFFSLPSRAWELVAGAAIALRSGALTRIGSSVVGWCGVLAMVVGVVGISESRPYPGMQAILPVLGAGGMITSGLSGEGILQRFLGGRLLRALGRISYAWYLVHWPLFLACGVRKSDADATLVSAALLGSIVIATVLTRYIEEPLRHGPLLAGRRRPLVLFCVAVGTGLATPSVVAILDPARHDPRLIGLQATRKDQIHFRGCEQWRNDPPPQCVFGAKTGVAQDTILLLGDSHAMHWVPALDRMGQAHGLRIVYFGISACPGFPLAIERKLVRFRACDELHAAIPAVVQSIRPRVLLSATSAGHWARIDGAALDVDRARAWESGLIELARMSRDSGSEVVVMHDGPLWPFDPVACLADHNDVRCAAPQKEWDRIPSQVRDVERSASIQASFDVVDPRGAICPSEPCQPVTENGTIKMRDAGHLTSHFSVSLTPFVSEQLVPFFGAAKRAP